MSFVRLTFPLACCAEGLAGDATGPDFSLTGPSGELERVFPSTDPPKEVMAIESHKVAWAHVSDVSLIDFSGRYQSFLYQLSQPCCRSAIMLVVVGVNGCHSSAFRHTMRERRLFMPAHRNNEKANAMYALYLDGHSLSQVAKAFSVTRQGVYKMFSKRGFAMRTVEPLPFIVWNGNKYTRRPNGYYARTSKGRRYLHIEMWEQANGPIPDGLEVHHADGDKTNNRLVNLELLTSSEHGRRHGFAGNQHVPSTGFRPVR